jgi:hypothetical protein
MYDGHWAMQLPGNPLWDDDTNVCTGFFLARPTALSRLFFRHVLHVLVTRSGERMKEEESGSPLLPLQDQAAFNLVNFEKQWRGLDKFHVHVLSPYLFVKSPIFYEQVQAGELFVVPNER